VIHARASTLACALTLACGLLTLACAAPAPPAEAARPSLEGTSWVMAGAKSDPASTPRLEFTREGRLAGFTGCNLLSGSYRLEGERLEVVAATTKRACLGPAGDAEAKLLAVLADRPRVSVEATRLVLTGARGGTFELVAAEPR